MYSLFLFTSALSYLALAPRGRARRAEGLGAVGAGDPRDGRDAPLRRARARLAGSLRGRAPIASGCARRSGRSAPSAVLGIPFWLTDLVLAGRFDAGVGGGGGSAPPRRRQLRLGCGRRLHRRLPRPADRARGGSGRAGRAPARDATADGVCGARPARRARDRTQLRLAGDAAPDLPASFRRAAGRGGNRPARARLGAGSARRARRRAGRLGVRQDARALQLGAGGAAGGPRGCGGVSRRDEPPERRPPRLRPALHPGLGAQRRLPARDASAR